MRPTRNAAILCIAWLGWTFSSLPFASACQVPVFRYALERWSPETFTVVVFHRGPMTPADQARFDAMGVGTGAAASFGTDANSASKTSASTTREPSASSPSRTAPANVQAIDVDVNATLDGDARALWLKQGDVPLPWAVVRYPSEEKLPPPWRGRLDSPELQRLADSPARRQITARLMAGDSAVWAIIKGGDPARDAAAANLLTAQLRKLSTTIKLPEPNPNAFGAEAVLSDLPIRLAFPIVILSRDAEAEKTFIPVLLHGDRELLATHDPIVIPIFGRGRALTSLSGADLTPQRIEAAAVFLAGQCSCQVKELNPGYDLLMSADWDSLLRAGRSASADASPSSPAQEPRRVAAADLPPSAVVTPPEDEPQQRRRLLKYAIAGMAVVAMVLGWVALRGGRIQN